jgi:peptidoglycan/xylan/chitin deacetylase (PgdA/CDA1 family)
MKRLKLSFYFLILLVCTACLLFLFIFVLQRGSVFHNISQRFLLAKGRYIKKLSRNYSIARGKAVRLMYPPTPPDTSWITKAGSFKASKVLISDFEQQVTHEHEWIGKNVDLNRTPPTYSSISGKAYLHMRVHAGSTGSIEKIFDTAQDFSKHHFQFWIRSNSLDLPGATMPAYHSEIESEATRPLDPLYKTYMFFYSDANNYSRYRVIFFPQYNDWYHVALHRGDTTKTDTGRGVDWHNVKKIRLEVKGKTIPFDMADVNVGDDTLQIHQKGWIGFFPPFHTGARVQFQTNSILPGGLSLSTFYWVHYEGTTGRNSHIYKFATSRKNLLSGIYVDLTSPANNCSGNVVTLPEIMLDQFEAVETLPIPFITFRFDDNYQNTYAYAKPILGEFGWKGVFAVVTQRENTEGYQFCLDCGNDEYVSYDNVRAMQNDGWDIVVHGFHHKVMGDGELSGMPDTDSSDMLCYNRECTEEEFAMGRRVLESEGLIKGSRFWVWPFGLLEAISDISLRLIPEYYALGSACYPKAPAGIPLTNRYTLPIAELNLSMTEEQQLASLKQQIDATCEYGGWLTILLHRVYVPDGAGHKDEHSTIFLRELCNYIKWKQQTCSHPPVVATFSDIYDNIIARQTEPGESSLKTIPSFKPPVTRHRRSFQLLPAEDGLVEISATDQPIVVTLPPAEKAKDRTYTLIVADIVKPNTITVMPYGKETINGKTASYTGFNTQGKLLKIKADDAVKNWIIRHDP